MSKLLRTASSVKLILVEEVTEYSEVTRLISLRGKNIEITNI
jgi:hypothetical protein